jgi:hypothetical protein
LAERQFRVGKYYERQHRPASAGVYYRDVMRRFGDTKWSGQAQKQLTKLKLPGPESATEESPKEVPTEGTEEKKEGAGVDTP